MAIGTAFTLFFVPAIYLLIARDHRAHEKVAVAEAIPAGARAALNRTA
jgi:hypothetical protein